MESPRFNPWKFIPFLYFSQAVPVALIQELATIIYKDLGIADAEIARWTALIALPWSLQMILGPFVDFNKTKRWWILTMQLLIAGGLSLSAFALQTPKAFELTLLIFAFTGIMSALCNIAIDGFAVLSMQDDQRGAYVGMMSTFFRLGRVFVISFLVWLAGTQLSVPALSVESSPYKELSIANGLVLGDKVPLQPEIKVPSGVTSWRIEEDGKLFVTTAKGEQPLGDLEGTFPASTAQSKLDPKTTWFWVLVVAAIVYALSAAANRFRLPQAQDTPREATEGNRPADNLARTFSLLLVALGAYFTVNALWRLGGHAVWNSFDGKLGADGKPDGPLKIWRLNEPNTMIGFDLGIPSHLVEWVQFGLSVTAIVLGLALAKRSFPRSEMGRALSAFVRQPGFPAILFFILFYRFAEVLVGRISALFLKSSLIDGGLAVDNVQLGWLNGVGSIGGLLVGGILGGLFIQKLGLKRSFIPLALAMHVPNLMYLWASMSGVPSFADLTVNPILLGLIFLDNVGYGFGFTGYMVYLTWVAQRTPGFETTHYAIGTGLGALTIWAAGALAGQLLTISPGNFTGPFIGVLLLAIPGLIALWLVPLDDSHRKIKVEVD